VAVASKTESERTAFLGSLEALLRPLMPLALNYGVSYADAQSTLRSLFIEAMTTRITTQGREASPARLALMAGMNRQEVVKLSSDQVTRRKEQEEKLRRVDLVSTMLSVWHDDRRFNTPYGAPLDLSLAPERGFKTVDDLIAVACPGEDRELLIDSLVTSGSVEVHGGKFIRCSSRTFLPQDPANLQRILRIASSGGAMSSTLAFNCQLEGEELGNFERRAVTERLVFPEFRDSALSYVREHGQQFLERFDRWLTESDPRTADRDGLRVGVGVYFYDLPSNRVGN
jgi:hypothetical protein